MLECLILGDSIAVGTHSFRTECVAYAKGGWNSWQWNRDYLNKDLTAKTVIISLGSNDHKGVKTRQELVKMRDKVKGQRVFWILPAGNLKAGGVDIQDIQSIVKEIAKENNDVILTIPALQADGIHPSWRGYKGIVKQTR
jgi:lysophospholipase L1-like esterase